MTAHSIDTEHSNTLDVVDFAYQIIYMHEEIKNLRRERNHYKELYEINSKTITESINHNNKMIGTILTAAIDPDSIINKD